MAALRPDRLQALHPRIALHYGIRSRSIMNEFPRILVRNGQRLRSQTRNPVLFNQPSVELGVLHPQHDITHNTVSARPRVRRHFERIHRQ
jgi:hypothetical protein